MKRSLFISVLLISLFVVSPLVSAQGMMGNVNNPSSVTQDSSTTQDEADGKAVWEKLQAKEVICKDLTDDDFDVLGDYFMGQMVGNSHSTMNANMSKMMGDAGEKQMHIVMGKQFSGCNTVTGVAVTTEERGNFPMMGTWNQQKVGNPGFMMGGNTNGFIVFHILGLITWVIGVIFLLLGSLYFWKGITRREKR